jgi:cytochrome P450
VPGNARFLNEDLVLENFFLPKGTLMNLSNSYITQSDRFFKNPAKFDPTRWEREDTEINPYSTLAFGYGARMCIGRRTAEQEVYLTIIKILQNYRLEYHEEIPGIKIGLLANPDKPLNIVLIKRN